MSRFPVSQILTLMRKRPADDLLPSGFRAPKDKPLIAAFRKERKAQEKYKKKVERSRRQKLRRKKFERKPETRPSRLLAGEGPAQRAKRFDPNKTPTTQNVDSLGQLREDIRKLKEAASRNPKIAKGRRSLIRILKKTERESNVPPASTKPTNRSRKLEPLSPKEFHYLRNVAERIRDGEIISPEEFELVQQLGARLARQKANLSGAGEGSPGARAASRANEANKRLAKAEREARTADTLPTPTNVPEPQGEGLMGGLGGSRGPLIDRAQADRILSNLNPGGRNYEEVRALSGMMSEEERVKYGAEKTRRQAEQDLWILPVSSAVKQGRQTKYATKKKQSEIEQIKNDPQLSNTERVEKIEELFEEFVQNHPHALAVRGKKKIPTEQFKVARADVNKMVDSFIDTMMSLGPEGEDAVRRLFSRERPDPSTVFRTPDTTFQTTGRELSPWHENGNKSIIAGWLDQKRFFHRSNKQAMKKGDVRESILQRLSPPATVPNPLGQRTFIAGTDPSQTRVVEPRVANPESVVAFLDQVLAPGGMSPQDAVRVALGSKAMGMGVGGKVEMGALDKVLEQFGNARTGEPIRRPLYTETDFDDIRDLSPAPTKRMPVATPGGEVEVRDVSTVYMPEEDRVRLGASAGSGDLTGPEVRALADEGQFLERMKNMTAVRGVSPGVLREIVAMMPPGTVSEAARLNPPSASTILKNQERIRQVAQLPNIHLKPEFATQSHLDRLLDILRQQRYRSKFAQRDVQKSMALRALDIQNKTLDEILQMTGGDPIKALNLLGPMQGL